MSVTIEQTIPFYYDFAVDGGAVGDIPLRGGAVPAGAIITRTITEKEAAFASSGAAELALTLETAGDLQIATLFSAMAHSDERRVMVASQNGYTNYVLDFAASAGIYPQAIKIAATGIPVMNVTVAALTAGKYTLYITYFVAP